MKRPTPETPLNIVRRVWPNAYCVKSREGFWMVWTGTPSTDAGAVLSCVVGTGKSSAAAWRDAVNNVD